MWCAERGTGKKLVVGCCAVRRARSLCEEVSFEFTMKELFLLLAYLVSGGCGDACSEACKQTRIRGMRTADCYDRDLRVVPDCLSSYTEVLDLSHNRIREITKNDLDKFSSVKILYLGDNIITEMADHVLSDKSGLHTLDVSYNPFFRIPKVLFHMPSLRTLYMGNVRGANMASDIEDARPITSPLTYLDLSFNKFDRLPILGVVPTLLFYNVSGNDRASINATYFAGLCNLKQIFDDGFSPIFDDPCECWRTQSWLVERDVNFTRFNCKQQACAYELRSDDLEIYNNCRKLHESQMLEYYTKKVLIHSAIGLSVVIVLIAVLYYIVRRKRQKTKKKAVEMEKRKNNGGLL